jgi:hypothetical protein
MIEHLDIEWKIVGLLEAPISHECIYYNLQEDRRYPSKVFGLTEVDVHTYTLRPTNLFHQVLKAHLKDEGYDLAINTLPYILPIDDYGEFQVNIRFRLFSDRFLALSVEIPHIERKFSVEDLVNFQKISQHRLLECIARFCFNIHSHCPSPTKKAVVGWCAKPLMRITQGEQEIPNSLLVEIVTRHPGINDRAKEEVLQKNVLLNINEDLLLVDKQGVALLVVTDDRKGQSNRYRRISQLFEYALYAKTYMSVYLDSDDALVKEELLLEDAKSINAILSANVLVESVSARRGWDLLKEEFALASMKIPEEKEVPPFFKRPWFLGASAVVGFFVTIYKAWDFISGGE